MADKTEKKPGFVARMKGFGANIAKFFRDTKSELKKVVWPSKADVKTNTIVGARDRGDRSRRDDRAGCHFRRHPGPDHRRMIHLETEA